jgi:hypothetical protein
MSELYLPRTGWLIECTDDCAPEDHPLGDAYERFNLHLIDGDFPEVTLSGEYDASALEGNPRVASVRRMWFVSDHEFPWDDVPEDATGRRFHPCGVKGLGYFDREEALADLARKEGSPLAVLLTLWRSGPAVARPLARAVLDGDLAALTVLADALEEARHPDAGAVRTLAAAART